MIETTESELKKPRRVRRKPHVIPREENGIDLEQVSSFAISVCRKLQDVGYQAFIVGGAVRDLLIGHTPKDFDVATDATPEQVKQVTRRAIIIGRRFRLVHVSKGAETIEVSTFRGLTENGVKKDLTGRVIADNVFGEQYEDAARRDFTVNAMYFDPISGDLYDYHNGLLDIRKKRIRMIGDPEERYREDPVRILRAVRIAAKLGFSIDPKTSGPMAEMQYLLAGVPEARLADEFLKMLTSGSSVECIEMMNRYGLNIPVPLYEVLSKYFECSFVRKGLERCDARVHLGKSISSSFLFAVLLWENLKEHLNAIQKPMRVGQRYEEACQTLLEGRYLKGIQGRFISDMVTIWKLQPKFEVRTKRAALRLLDHPRFRAAYDFLLLRASCGEVPHELADWWTAFEAATEEDRLEMLKEIEAQERAARAESQKLGLTTEGEGSEKPKKRSRRRKSSSRRRHASSKASNEKTKSENPASQE